jgi:TetR/AcrR family transcriptional regulator, transcriptional repressor for nem operon
MIGDSAKFDTTVKRILARFVMIGAQQFDEDEVLAKALKVFWRNGVQATSMLGLALATGVQRGSLYNAYGAKEDLFLLAFEPYATGFLEAARSALSDPDPEHALQGFFEIAIADMTYGTPPHGCLSTKTAIECEQTSEAIQLRLRRFLDDLEKIVTTALSRDEMRMRLTLAPRDAAQIVVTYVRGLAVMERVYHNPKKLQHTADALVKSLLRGRRPRRTVPRHQNGATA